MVVWLYRLLVVGCWLLFVCDPSLHPHGPMQLWFTGRRWLLVVVVVVFVVVVVGAGAAYSRLLLFSVCTFFRTQDANTDAMLSTT